MKENSVFVLGWSGYVGSALIEKLRPSGVFPVLVGRNAGSDLYFDLSNPDYSFLSTFYAGDKLVFLSAISSPEFCANNSTESYKVNVMNTISLLTMLLDKGVDVLFASSDVVYGRTDVSVNERDVINPQFAYAEMKAEVEEKFRNCRRFKVMRLSYVWSLKDKFTQFLSKSYYENTEFEVFHPFIRSVVCLDDVIEFIEKFVLSSKEFPSLVNLAGPDFLSRLKMVEAFSEIKPLKYTVCHPGDDFFIYRPDQILMKSIYLDSVLGRRPNNVIDTIKMKLLEN